MGPRHHHDGERGVVRQNLDLIVDDGRPVPGLNANDTTKWGFTLKNHVYVWRSGVGVTATAHSYTWEALI